MEAQQLPPLAIQWLAKGTLHKGCKNTVVVLSARPMFLPSLSW
jgi:hypothetical protein